jgi:hypothetical protein
MKGLCVLCKTKHETTNPFSLLYLSLIQRVHNSPEGFAALSESEKLFYALSRFRNEINNGGFEQFFRNSSGSYYRDIESGLTLLDESQNLELLRHAKQIVFPIVPVPADTETRRRLLPEYSDPSGEEAEWVKKLDQLDRRFYSSPDTLSPKLKAFARERGLVPGESESSQVRD